MEEKVIEIFFGDLTAEKQREILDAFGENCNWDVIPIVVLPIGGDGGSGT